MNELQFSLIGLGVILVAGVFAYNKAQERKHRKLAERVFSGDHPDVLIGHHAAGSAEPGAERIEPVIADAGYDTEMDASGADARPADEPPEALADPAIDCVVRFESADPASGAHVWRAQNLALDKLTRPPVWCGLNERAGVWEQLTAYSAGEYRRLRAALQLADRRGPLTDSDLTLFFNGVQRLADEFLAVADLPARNDVLARAAEIDRFCAGVDIQIGLNVAAAGTPFSGARLYDLAKAAGLALREDGMFHALDAAGATLFALSNLEAALFAAEEMETLATHCVTFTLDVPRVANAAAALDGMVAMAKQFAADLGGSLVDDNRAPLTDNALALIRDKIVEIEQRMQARGLIAGSTQALRLFS